jgi:hypothetical protein
LILTDLGSRGITVEVGPSALYEAPDGVAITYGLYDGPADRHVHPPEAEQLAAAITTQLAANRAEPDGWPRPG